MLRVAYRRTTTRGRRGVTRCDAVMANVRYLPSCILLMASAFFFLLLDEATRHSTHAEHALVVDSGPRAGKWRGRMARVAKVASQPATWPWIFWQALATFKSWTGPTVSSSARGGERVCMPAEAIRMGSEELRPLVAGVSCGV